MDFTVVVIDAKGGGESRFSFSKDEITIGRVQGNDIILARGNVSKRHSRIISEAEQFLVVDLKSTNGTFVNGRRITAPQTLQPGDKIYVGDFVLGIEIGDQPGQGVERALPPQPPPPPGSSVAMSPGRGPLTGGAIAVDDQDVVGSDDLADLIPQPETLRKGKRKDDSAVEVIEAISERSVQISAGEAVGLRRSAAPPAAIPVADESGPSLDDEGGEEPESLAVPVVVPPLPAHARKKPPTKPPTKPPREESSPGDDGADLRAHLNLLELVFGRLASEFDMGSDAFVDAEDAEMRVNVEKSIRSIASQLIEAGAFPESIDPDAIVREALEEAIGLGPLSNVLHDPDVTEIWLSPSGSVMVARGGKRAVLSERFTNTATAELAVRRLQRSGAPMSEPESDSGFSVRLSNGSRAFGALSPDLGGPFVRVWASRCERRDMEQLVKRGAVSVAASDLLKAAIHAQKSVLVVGGLSSAKEGVAQALAQGFPGSAWTLSVGVTVPVEPELNAVALDLGAVPSGESARALSRWHAAMRSRPERLYIDELGDEWTPVLAVPLAEALQAGRGGSVVLMDGLTVEGAITRWTGLCEVARPAAAARALVASAVQVAALVGPPSPGARGNSVVSRVVEVSLGGAGEIELVDLVTPRAAPGGASDLTSRGKQFLAICTKGG